MSRLLEGMDAATLLQHMPADVRTSLETLERAGTDWNEVGTLLAASPNAGVLLTGTGQWTAGLWDAVKWEFRSFLCTDSERYGALRAEWEGRRHTSSPAAVAILATQIGATLGVASGVVLPMVTWLCVVAHRIGTDAVCAALSTRSSRVADLLQPPPE